MQLKLSLPSVSALPPLCMAQISPQLAHGSLLKHRRRHFFYFFLQHLNEFLRLPTPPHSAVADGCLAVNSSESLNKSACNRGEEEEEKRETEDGNRRVGFH